MRYGYMKQITKEQYERGVANRGYLTKEDAETVFDDSERLGYGVYSPTVHLIEKGKTEPDSKELYVVRYALGDSCD